MEDMNGWYLTGLPGLIKVTPKQKRFDGHHQFSISNVAARKVLPQIYYWSAPSSYLGNKVSADGTCLNANLICWEKSKTLKGGGTEGRLSWRAVSPEGESACTWSIRVRQNGEKTAPRALFGLLLSGGGEVAALGFEWINWCVVQLVLFSSHLVLSFESQFPRLLFRDANGVSDVVGVCYKTSVFDKKLVCGELSALELQKRCCELCAFSLSLVLFSQGCLCPRVHVHTRSRPAG